MATESMNTISVRTEKSVKHWNLNLHAKLPQEVGQHKDLQRNLLLKAPPTQEVGLDDSCEVEVERLGWLSSQTKQTWKQP